MLLAVRSLFPSSENTLIKPLITGGGTVAGEGEIKPLLHPQNYNIQLSRHLKIRIKPKQDQRSTLARAIFGTWSVSEQERLPSAAFTITAKRLKEPLLSDATKRVIRTLIIVRLFEVHMKDETPEVAVNTLNVKVQMCLKHQLQVTGLISNSR